MKKTLSIIIYLLSAVCLMAQANDPLRYASKSVLADGRWVKIAVSQSGVYKLSYEDIAAMGLEPGGVRLYGYGGKTISQDFQAPYTDDLPEVAIFMEKGSDGVFSAGDYILFYAEATIGWQYDKTKGFSHFRNPYSDKGYYFLSSKAGEGRRIAVAENPTGLSATATVDAYQDRELHEKDLISLAKGGQEFFGEQMTASKPEVQVSFDARNLLPNEPIKTKISVVATAVYQTSLDVYINGNLSGQFPLTPRHNNGYNKGAETLINFLHTPTEAQQTLLYRLILVGSANETYLNYVELYTKKILAINDDEYYFRHIPNIISNTEASKLLVEGATQATQFWQITDPLNITRYPTTTEQSKTSLLVANDLEKREFVAINTKGNFPKPEILGEIANQNLHALPQADMVIISHRDFTTEAERLARFHQNQDGIKTHVVDAEKIFNEFSSGTPDATAYRRFMKMFYDRSTQRGTPPRWLLLFGDGSYDNRGIETMNHDQRRLLTYQATNSLNTINAYTSDDYFTYLDDTTKAMTPESEMDIAVGRLPVMNATQAKTVVDKTIHYGENGLKGDWKNRMLFVADDGDDNIHVSDCDQVAELTQSLNQDILVRKLYLDAYKQETFSSTESYPMAEQILDNYIKQGVLMINFMGHGSHLNWTNEKILTTSKIQSMVNDKYPIYVTATCDFSSYDQTEDSGGELLLWNNTGGTMALITTSRTVYTDGNKTLNLNLSTNLFKRDSQTNLPLTIGEILTKSKNIQKNTPNKFAFALLGDPALRLAYAYEGKVVTDSICGNAVVSEKMDTISALSEVRLSGHIADQSGNKVSNFNGILSINVFDKIENVRTLANDPGSTPFEYNDRPNPIFRGSTEVRNGEWTTTFLVPKDIKYNFGQGKVYYYAYEQDGMEANGSFERFIIGGENKDAKPDHEGPQIHLYMNSRQFKDGQRVNRSPLFIADLFDESGINTSGNGIGHDIVLRMEGSQEFTLNEYYISNFGDYRSGTVEYQLSDLAEGRYKMWFRAWDLQNNSSTAEISFEVSDKVKIASQLSIYPNPATDHVTFSIQHDRPYQGLEVRVRVFDVMGKTLWISETERVTDSETTEIRWDFATKGLHLPKGIYLVRVELNAKGEKPAYHTAKMFVK